MSDQAGESPDDVRGCRKGCCPKSCAAQGKNCGTVSDGCGLTLNCGSCSAPETCGGGGTANVCGAAATTETSIEAESMTVVSGNLVVSAESGASGGQLVKYWTNGTASKTFTTAGNLTSLSVMARGEPCSGVPHMVVKLDGATVLSSDVSATTLTAYAGSLAISSGTHTIDVGFDNDFFSSGVCDRNLVVDVIRLGSSSGGGGSTDMAVATADLATPSSSDLAAPAPDLSTPPATGDVIIGAVGDINPGGVFGTSTNPGKTAQNLANMNPAIILGLGDFQYTTGTLSNILAAFDKNFSTLKAIIRPTAGPTHDVASATDTLGYESYWGRKAYEGYSFDIGNWHIISLPSAAYRYGVNTAGVLSWLNADLTANTKPCTLAFWHEPYWSRSTSTHPSTNGIQTAAVKPWLDTLYQHGAEIVLNGHQHNYQRFAPMRPDGTPDANGLRAFVVGSGGIGFYPFTSTAPNTDASNDATYGALKLTLKSNGYDWQFIPNTAGGFSDSGSGSCH